MTRREALFGLMGAASVATTAAAIAAPSPELLAAVPQTLFKGRGWNELELGRFHQAVFDACSKHLALLPLDLRISCCSEFETRSLKAIFTARHPNGTKLSCGFWLSRMALVEMNDGLHDHVEWMVLRVATALQTDLADPDFPSGLPLPWWDDTALIRG